jgi:hypothetical protein
MLAEHNGYAYRASIDSLESNRDARLAPVAAVPDGETAR